MGVQKKVLSGWWIVPLLSVASLAAAGGDLRLVEAVREGDQETVRSLLQQANVNASQADGATALHWAAHRDDLETANLLLRAGADASAANDYGITPVSLACTNRSAAMVGKLLEAGANPSAAQLTGETLLMTCARTGSTEAVKLLLAHGAEVNARESKKRQTALMWAVAGKHSEIARALIEHGADIRTPAKDGFTPLLFAARGGDLESARMLLEAGANVNESTPKYGTALVVASASGHQELAIYLLQQGADPNAADGNGTTPLHHAVQRGFSALTGIRYDDAYRVRPPNMPELAQALLVHGADPNARITNWDQRGPDGVPFNMVDATPFFLAAVSADASLMRILAEGRADPKLAAVGMTTPLMAAARGACTGSCAFRGGNVSNTEEAKRALEAVKVAVALGSDVNAANEDGQTALHNAAFTGAEAIVQFLADQGAKVNVKNNYGETPWSMAAGLSPVLRYRGLYGSHQSTANLLLKMGATKVSQKELDPTAPPPPGQ